MKTKHVATVIATSSRDTSPSPGVPAPPALILTHAGLSVYYFDQIFYVLAGWQDQAHTKMQFCYFKTKASPEKATMHFRTFEKHPSDEGFDVSTSKVANVKYWVDALQYQHGERYDPDNKGKKGSDGGNIRRVKKKVMRGIIQHAETYILTPAVIDDVLEEYAQYKGPSPY